MSWPGTLASEIVRSRDQPLSEQVLPDPIDSNTSRQRILLVKQPPREIPPIRFLAASIENRQDGRRARMDFVSVPSVDAADMHKRVTSVLCPSCKRACLCRGCRRSKNKLLIMMLCFMRFPGFAICRARRDRLWRAKQEPWLVTPRGTEADVVVNKALITLPWSIRSSLQGRSVGRSSG